MGGQRAESGGAPDAGRGNWPAVSCPAPFLNSVFPSGSQNWRGLSRERPSPGPLIQAVGVWALRVSRRSSKGQTVRPHAPGQTDGPSSKDPERLAFPELGGNFHHRVKVWARQCPALHKLRAPPRGAPPPLKRPRLTHGVQPIPRLHSCSFACPFPLVAGIEVRPFIPRPRGRRLG